VQRFPSSLLPRLQTILQIFGGEKIEEGKEGAKREQFPEGSGGWEKGLQIAGIAQLSNSKSVESLVSLLSTTTHSQLLSLQ
jgi:hypothetical protein